MMDDHCADRENYAYRSLVGAMQWPASKSTAYAPSATSFLEANSDEAFVEDLVESKRISATLHLEGVGPTSAL